MTQEIGKEFVFHFFCIFVLFIGMRPEVIAKEVNVSIREYVRKLNPEIFPN